LENGVERVKIADFGLARVIHEAQATGVDAVAGTPQYMSPEQAEGKKLDYRSDLFSLGCVMYAMCTGRSPFRAESIVAAIKRVCEDTPRPIREINPEIPDWLAATIDNLLAKDPSERFQSTEEVHRVLGEYLAAVQHPSQAPLPSVSGKSTQKPARGSKIRLWHVVTCAGLLCLALAAVVWNRTPRETALERFSHVDLAAVATVKLSDPREATDLSALPTGVHDMGGIRPRSIISYRN